MTVRPAVLQLVLATDPLRLFERAAEDFLRPLRGGAGAPFPSPAYLLALRQGGLRDDLIRLAAERGVPGWFDPPLCIFHELPERLGCTDRTPCDGFERLVILGGVLRQVGGEVFGRARRPEDYLAALDRLFGDLVAEGVEADAFGAALEARGDRDEFEKERDGELALVYRLYLERLREAGRRDGRDTWLDCARAIAADPARVRAALGDRRELRLFGLNDLRGGWRALLRALRDSGALDRIVVYSAEPLDFGAGLEAETVRLEEPATLATRLFAEAGEPAPVTVQAIAAPDVERETEEVARRVRLLLGEGVAPDRIAIVTRQARPYVDLAVAALDRFGVPASARRRHALRAVPVVRAVRCLFAAAADGWSRHALVELAEQPYLASELDARVLNYAGYRGRVSGLDGWATALRRLLHDAERRERAESEDLDGRGLPPSARVRAALATFERFAERARVLDATRTLAEWLDWLAGFLADDPWHLATNAQLVPAGRFDVVRLDLAGWQGLVALVTQWRGALAQWGGAEERLAAAEFHRQLDDLLDGDVALWTPTPRGVQVLEGFAAAYRTFEHLFVVGLEAGRFPVLAPGSPVFDEAERAALAALGLPFEPRRAWELRERELFRILAAGAGGSLTVSWPRLDVAGRETVRSAFVEALGEACTLVGAGEDEELPASRVLTEGARLFDTHDAAAHAVLAARIERDRRTGRLSPWNGLVAAPALVAWLGERFGDERLWSPTQLEAFAKCPWSYFSARLLRVSRLEDPDEEMDPAARGRVLHEALRRFYEAWQARTGAPVFLRQDDLARADAAIATALDAAIADVGSRAWLGHPTLLAAKRAELLRMLRKFLAAEVQEHEDMFNTRKRNAPKMVRTGVVGHELAFDDVVLERGGVRFRFRGSIDRVEAGIDERIDDAGDFLTAVDYKTTKYAAPGGGDKAAWEDGVVLQIPLYAYALTQLNTGSRIARVEYRALKQAEAVHPLELVQFDKKAGGAVVNPEAVARMDAALDAVAGHVLRARTGEFPAAPAPSCGCPPFCHGREICRVPAGAGEDR